MLAGVVLAALAAVTYEVAYVLQALGARAAPERQASPGLLASLLRRPAFAAGAVLGIVGFGLQVLALRHVALAVVQPILALGLIALLALARAVLGERPGVREAAGALLVATGAGLVFAVAPGHEHGNPTAAPFVLGALGLVVVAPYVLRLGNGWGLVAGAAAADVLVALAGARMGGAGGVATAIGWGALAGGAALAAVTSESAALQRLPAVRVGPVILAAQAIVPVLLATAVAGQAFPEGVLRRTVLVAGLAVLGGGVALLASSRALAQVMAAEVAPAQAPAP